MTKNKENPLRPEDYAGLVWPLPETTGEPEGAWALNAAYAFAERLRTPRKPEAPTESKEPT